MADKVQAILPGDFPTTDALADIPIQLSSVYLAMKDRVLQLGESGLAALESANSQLELVHEQISQLESALGAIESALHADSGTRYVYIERFQSETGTESSTLYIDPKGGYLSLYPDEMVDQLKRVKALRILKSQSRGIPGNNMVVQRLEWEDHNGMKLVKVELADENRQSANIASLFDGRPDTLFEWELNVVKRKQRLKSLDGVQLLRTDSGMETDVQQATQGYGWEVHVVYPEQEQVDPEDKRSLALLLDQPGEPAQLVLEFEFDGEMHGVLDILPAASGGMFPLLFLLQISRDGVSWEDVLKPPGRSDRLLVRLEEGSRLDLRLTVNMDGVRWLRVGLRAGGWYTPTLGLAHPYAVAIVDEQFRQSLLGITLKSEHRVLKQRQPTESPYVGSILAIRDENNVAQLTGAVLASAVMTMRGVTMRWLSSAIGAKAVAWLGSAAPVAAFVLGVAVLAGIFRETKERHIREIITGYDVLSGWRSAIAIREIRVLRPKYRSSGEWVSRAVRFPAPVRRLALHSESSAPEGTTLQYYISTDMTSWTAVTPIQKGGTIVDLGTETSQLYLKIAMSTDNELVSPLVYSVGLEGRG